MSLAHWDFVDMFTVAAFHQENSTCGKDIGMIDDHRSIFLQAKPETNVGVCNRFNFFCLLVIDITKKLTHRLS